MLFSAAPPKLDLSIFGFTDVQMKKATLSWQLTKPADYIYTLEIKAPDQDWELLAANITATNFTVTNLIAEDQYEFRLSAVTREGDKMPPTAPLILEPRKGTSVL